MSNRCSAAISPGGTTSPVSTPLLPPGRSLCYQDSNRERMNPKMDKTQNLNRLSPFVAARRRGQAMNAFPGST